MSDVFVALRGSITQPSKTALRKAGVVVVEVDDLAHVQFMRASDLVSGDDMLFAAMDALRTRGSTYNKGDEQRARFADAMGELVANAWTNRTGQAR